MTQDARVSPALRLSHSGWTSQMFLPNRCPGVLRPVEGSEQQCQVMVPKLWWWHWEVVGSIKKATSASAAVLSSIYATSLKHPQSINIQLGFTSQKLSHKMWSPMHGNYFFLLCFFCLNNELIYILKLENSLPLVMWDVVSCICKFTLIFIPFWNPQHVLDFFSLTDGSVCEKFLTVFSVSMHSKQKQLRSDLTVTEYFHHSPALSSLMSLRSRVAVLKSNFWTLNWK